MEVSGDENFKYIPFRCYQSDDYYIQKLIRPITEEGQKKILQNLIDEVFLENSEKGYYTYFSPNLICGFMNI